MSELSMGLALSGESEKIINNLMTYMFSDSRLTGEDRANPSEPEYGLINWFTNIDVDSVYYGDDNARVILSLAAVFSKGGYDQYKGDLVRCLLGNLRTSGKSGFHVRTAFIKRI